MHTDTLHQPRLPLTCGLEVDGLHMEGLVKHAETLGSSYSHALPVRALQKAPVNSAGGKPVGDWPSRARPR